MKNSRLLISTEDPSQYKEVEKYRADVGPAQKIILPVSGLSGLEIPGGKCEHGVYIPANSESADHAPYCSLCYPSIIFAKEHAEYRA